MGRRHRELEIAERRVTVARLYIQGKTIIEIADVCGCHFSQISRDLSTLRAEWKKASKELADKIIATELAKIDEVERQAWEGWNRSIQDREVKTDEKTNRKKANATKSVVRREGQAGNPMFLMQIDKCIERRIKLLGIDLKPVPPMHDPGMTALTPDQEAAAMDATVPRCHPSISAPNAVTKDNQPDTGETTHIVVTSVDPSSSEDDDQDDSPDDDQDGDES